jgi:hypothetical protein
MQRIYLNMGHRVTVSWAWRNPMVTPALTQGNPLTDTWIEIFFLKKKRFYVQNLAMWNRPFELPKNSINLGFRTSIHCPVILFSKGLRVSRKSSSDLGGFQNILELPCDAAYTMKPVMPFMQSLLVRFLAADWTLISHGTAGTGSDLTYETERKTGPRTVNRKYISLNGRWSM